MKLLDMAEEDPETGDLIYETEVTGAAGESKTKRVNVSRLLRPGARRTGNQDILRLEAQWAADGDCPDNPALPVNGEAMETFLGWLDGRDLDPAWEVCDRTVTFPDGDGDRDKEDSTGG